MIEIPGGQEKLEEHKLIIVAEMKDAKDNRGRDERVSAIKDHSSAAVEDTFADDQLIYSFATH